MINVIRSNRKTVSIRVNEDLSVTVRAPRYASNRDIERILEEKESWIRKHQEQMRIQNEAAKQERVEMLTGEELKELADRACTYIPQRVTYFAPLVGVNYGRITIRNQKTRWGSCSSKGNLNFNCLLMLAPPQVLDYVVVHELCHRKEMNHSKAFWKEVERVMPSYKDSVRWLRKEGGGLMKKCGY